MGSGLPEIKYVWMDDSQLSYEKQESRMKCKYCGADVKVTRIKYLGCTYIQLWCTTCGRWRIVKERTE